MRKGRSSQDIAAAGIFILGTRGDRSFYRLSDHCYGSGPSSPGNYVFGHIQCVPAFPSRAVPVLDLSPLMGREGSADVSIPKIIGFAADGVAEVGIVDQQGRRHMTSVESNVYFAENLADIPAQAQVALDSEGEVVWRREVPKFDKLKTERQR